MLYLRSATLALGDRQLFHDLDLHVCRGQLVGVTGESGCGKTSLLRAVLGFVALTAGSIEVCGLPLDVHHVHEIRRRTAYVPQELQPPVETGRDLIRLSHDLEANRTASASRSSSPSSSLSTTAVVADGSPSVSLLSALGLEPTLLDLSASKLSGGQRQRLLLAAALSVPKPLLLLDEPSSALDEESTHRVVSALLHACHDENRAVLVVSHDPILLTSCDQVITLSPLP
ncbi:MAG: ATP-binding cassette domain-containing protein [Bacteroidaceae bacterium]|nr:ATP-binding cassette domain-containing protein [Bacteroidaceae bacterium]